jgi:uncharacterized protein (TIGR00251 family)
MTKSRSLKTDIPTARLSIFLIPRGGRDNIEGWVDGRLRVRVAAPPVDGRANEALIRLIARTLGLAPSKVAIIAGAQSRSKQLDVEGLSLKDIEQLLGCPR